MPLMQLHKPQGLASLPLQAVMNFLGLGVQGCGGDAGTGSRSRLIWGLIEGLGGLAARAWGRVSNGLIRLQALAHGQSQQCPAPPREHPHSRALQDGAHTLWSGPTLKPGILSLHCGDPCLSSLARSRPTK